MRELTVGKNDAGQRLDKFITKALDIPMSLLYKSIRLKKIKVNRKRAEISTKLCEGDTVQCFLPDDLFAKLDTATGIRTDGTAENAEELLLKINPQLDIIYEDDNIIVVNKPQGLSVHEDEGTRTNTLITFIQSYLYKKGEYSPAKEQSFAPALCNRIDKNTSGLVIAAKNAEALRIMNEKIKLRQIDKFYLAAVHGIPEPRENTIYGYLRKETKTNTVKIRQGMRKGLPPGTKHL